MIGPLRRTPGSLVRQGLGDLKCDLKCDYQNIRKRTIMFIILHIHIPLHAHASKARMLM